MHDQQNIKLFEWISRLLWVLKTNVSSGQSLLVAFIELISLDTYERRNTINVVYPFIYYNMFRPTTTAIII